MAPNDAHTYANSSIRYRSGLTSPLLHQSSHQPDPEPQYYTRDRTSIQYMCRLQSDIYSSKSTLTRSNRCLFYMNMFAPIFKRRKVFPNSTASIISRYVVPSGNPRHSASGARGFAASLQAFSASLLIFVTCRQSLTSYDPCH